MKTTKFYNLNAEKHLLIQLLIETNFFSKIYNKIDTQVFYFQSHQILYRSITILYHKKVVINLPNLLSLLYNELVAETIINYIVILFNDRDKFRLLNINNSIKSILDNFVRRELQACCSKIVDLTMHNNLSSQVILKQANLLISNIYSRTDEIPIKSISHLLLETIIEIDRKTTVTKHLFTGFFDLDNLLHGLQKSDLIIIAGRPSMGKTAFMLSLVRNISDIQSLPIIIFSLEMSNKQVIYRLISNETNIPTSRLREGNLTTSDWEILNRALSVLSNLNVYLDDQSNLDVSEMQNKLTALKQIYLQLGLVVIDYLQLLEYKAKSLQRHLELSYITRHLKIIAKDFNIPVIVLSQLSRNVEFRLNKRPLLSDLRESGCLSYFNNKPYFFQFHNHNWSNQIQLTHLHKGILGVATKSLAFVQYTRIQPQVNLIKRQLNTGHKLVYKLDCFVSSVIITIDHYIFTIRGWKKLVELNKNDLVAVLDMQYLIYSHKKINLLNSNLIFLSISNLFYIHRCKVYDFWIPKTNNFFVNTILIHNSIEQDADIVLFLYRDFYYQDKIKQSGTDVCEVIIAKHRNGPTGTVSLLFDSKSVSFKNLML